MTDTAEAGGASAPLVPLDLKITSITGGDEQIPRNVRAACARGLPQFQGHVPRPEPVLICGGGPSLMGEFNDIRRRQKRGAKVVAVNAVHQRLLDAGIKPWAHVMCDADESVASFIPEKDSGAIYFIASQCHPSVFDAAVGRDVVVWHALQGVGEREVVEECLAGTPWALVAGGSTAALRCLNLKFLMGFRAFHLYGLDSCFYGTRQHAYDNVTKYGQTIEVWCGGKMFETSPQMAAQARDFEQYLRQWNDLFPGATLNVHGRGLIPEICRERNRMIKRARSNA